MRKRGCLRIDSRCWLVKGCAAALLWGACAGPALGVEQDAQSWDIVNYEHRFNSRWTAGLETEVRIRDDISQYSETLLTPQATYSFNRLLSFGLGFKYVNKYRARDEYRIHQDVNIAQKFGALGVKHKFRLEERYFDGLEGVFPWFIYTFSVTHPLRDPWYFSASEQVRFSLSDKGMGPVYGFDQNRAYAGLGLHATGTLRLQLGYLWRYQARREGPHQSDNVVRFQILINTGRKD